MSLESDNLKLKNTQVNPASTQVVAGSTTVSSDTKTKPLDFKAQDAKVEENSKSIDSEIIKFVNSDEFKVLGPEAQIQVLKERFMPGATTEEINKTISLAKQSAQNTTETSNSVDENSGYELSGNESEVEKAAYAYIEKQKLKNVDIDGLRSMLASKTNRTPEEEKLFNQIQEAFKKDEVKSNAENVDDSPLLTAEEMLSENWMKKKPEEKLQILADKYFSKTDKKYNGLSDNEKRFYLYKNIKKLAVSLSDNGKNDLSVADYSRVSGVLNALNAKGMSVEDYNKLSKDDKKEFYNTYQKQVLKDLKDLVPADYRKTAEWQNMSADQKLYLYADAFLSRNDPSYENLTPEDRTKYIEAKSNEMISAFIPNWQNMDKDSKESILTDTLITIDTVIENDMSYDKFQNLSFDKKIDLKSKYKAKHGYQKSEIDNTYTQIINDYIQKNGEAPTIDDVIKEIKANESVSDVDKKRMLVSLELQKKLNDGRNTKVPNHPSYEDLALAKKTTVEQVINNDFKNLEKVKPEKQVKRLANMFCKTNGNEELINQIKAQALEKGFSEDVINNALNMSQAHKDAMVCASRNNDAEMYDKAFEISKDIGDKKACEVASYNIPIALEGEAKEIASVNIVNNHQDYIDNLTKGINDLEPDPVTFGNTILNREDVSNAGKSLFTQSIILTSPTPERQLEYSKSFSQIDNAAVTEGLAAASKFVDSSVRNQYNSYVDKAMAQYPPEQQSVIRSARESGQISKETLAQTSVADSVTGNSTSRNVQNTSNAISSSNTIKTNSNSKTIISSQPAFSTAHQTVELPEKTQVTQSVSAKADTTALAQKKEILLNKISTYEAKKAERTKEKNIEKTKADNVELQNKDLQEVSGQKTVMNSSDVDDLVLTEDEQDVLKSIIVDIFQKNSVSAAYSKLVETFGESGKEKFLEVFVQKGKGADVRSFAENYKGNTDTILKLIGYCQSESLKFDLLKMLPASSITELITSQKLTSTDFEKLLRENKVESSVILDYINQNKGSMSVQDMKKYMSFLSLADRNALMEILKNTKGSDEWLAAQKENMRTITSDSPSFVENETENDFIDNLPTLEDGLSMGSNKLSMRGQYNKMKKRGPFFLKA